VSEYFDTEQDAPTEVSLRTMIRILAQAQRHWRWLVGFMVCIVAVSALDAVYTFLRKQIVDQFVVLGSEVALRQALIAYGGTILLQAIGVFGFIYFTGILGQRIQYDLRQAMFEHLQDLSFAYFNRTPVGWIMSRVTSDSERVAHLVTWGLLDVTWGTVNIVTSALFMFVINRPLALIVLAIIPILLMVGGRFESRILAEYRTVRRLNSQITGDYNENISGVRVVKALSREEQNLREFSELTSKMYRASYRAAWLSALFLPTVQLVSALALGTIVWYGALPSRWGGMTIGSIQAFVSYLVFMIWPIQDLARVYAEMQHAVASAERIFALLDTVPQVRDRDGAVDPGSLRGDIVFDHVDFCYDPDFPVLADFNLRVKQGETIALVGPTGGGKSTIVNLLSRFYEPDKGMILIAGRDYTELSLHAIHSRLGVVLQTPHLFSGTIRENIRYGRLEATNEELEAAARVAGAHDFIATLEKGYESEVGEGGQLLSVGEKQLISLARAIVAEPEILVMDEATSSVDTLTESLIQQGMQALMSGRTSFVIAHRLSTIRRADRILLIDKGSIVEMGTHAQLLQAKGRYYRLYVQQFRREMEQESQLSMAKAAAS
jgi:ATP-binding cassette subfamily B protein